METDTFRSETGACSQVGYPYYLIGIFHIVCKKVNKKDVKMTTLVSTFLASLLE